MAEKRLIDASELIKSIRGTFMHVQSAEAAELLILLKIKDAPTVKEVNVEREASWRFETGLYNLWRCVGRDGCGNLSRFISDYCPNCGAKMDMQETIRNISSYDWERRSDG